METLLEEYSELIQAPAPTSTGGATFVPGPSLESGWAIIKGEGPQLILWVATRCLSAAPDDTLWYGTERKGAWIYSSLERKWVQAWPSSGEGSLLSLSAVSSEVAWAVYRTSDTAPWRIGKLRKGHELVEAPELPEGERPKQVSAAKDGTVWALSESGTMFSLSDTGREWSRVVIGGQYKVERIAVGSAKHVRILATGTGLRACLSLTASGGWEPDPSWPPLPGPAWLAACEDGTAWARIGGFIYVWAAGAGWRYLPGARLNRSDPVELNAAGSRLCIYTRAPSQAGWAAYKRGVLAQDPYPFPPQGTQEKAAYQAISQGLGIVLPEGLRGQYTNSAAPFDIYYTQVDRLERPPEVDEAAWKEVKAQLLRELQYVSAAYRLFKNMKEVTDSLGILNAQLLPGIASLVGLDIRSPEDQRSLIPVFLYTMFRACVGEMQALVPFPYSIAVNLLSTAIFFVIDEATKEPERRDDPNYAYPIRFAELSDQMADLYKQSLAKNDNLLTAVVRDWGKLEAVGSAVVSGRWQWPADRNAEMVKATSMTLELYFYRSLMQAKWQILYFEYIKEPDYRPPAWAADIPDFLQHYEGPYDFYYGEHKYHRWNFWICNSLGNKGIPPPRQSIEPLPSKELFDKLIGRLGQNKVYILKGIAGWSLKVHLLGQEQQLARLGYLLGSPAEEAPALFSPPRPVEG